MIPSKLKARDEVRIVSPSRSLGIISHDARSIAKRRFSDLGLKVSFSKHAEEIDEFNSSPAESRAEDLHEAFSDNRVKAVFTSIGGFNSNQLLRYLDYKMIKSNPKIFCGYSDITALQNAIYAKTGLVTYSGPHFSTFGMEKGIEFTLGHLKKCLFSSEPFHVTPSKKWSDDPWYKDQKNRTFVKNNGYLVINEGEAKGTIIGGNLCTFNLLQGTEFMPPLKDKVLFIEDDEESKPPAFDRDLQSLIHQPDFDKVRGVVIGRFQKASEMTDEKLIKIIKTKKELGGIPVIAGADFGHTSPQITFPIGGTAEILAYGKGAELRITEH